MKLQPPKLLIKLITIIYIRYLNMSLCNILHYLSRLTTYRLAFRDTYCYRNETREYTNLEKHDADWMREDLPASILALPILRLCLSLSLSVSLSLSLSPFLLVLFIGVAIFASFFFLSTSPCRLRVTFLRLSLRNSLEIQSVSNGNDQIEGKKNFLYDYISTLL